MSKYIVIAELDEVNHGGNTFEHVSDLNEDLEGSDYRVVQYVENGSDVYELVKEIDSS